MKNTIKVISLLLALLFAAAVFAGCGGGEESKVDCGGLASQMAAASEFPSMLTINSGDDNEERGFSAISDLSFDKAASFSLMYASDGSAYELAVIELKDAGDMKALENSLRAHIENRVKQYKYYDPEQVSRAESALVASRGRYAALIMCDDASAVKTVFEKAFE